MIKSFLTKTYFYRKLLEKTCIEYTCSNLLLIRKNAPNSRTDLHILKKQQKETRITFVEDIFNRQLMEVRQTPESRYQFNKDPV